MRYDIEKSCYNNLIRGNCNNALKYVAGEYGQIQEEVIRLRQSVITPKYWQFAYVLRRTVNFPLSFALFSD